MRREVLVALLCCSFPLHGYAQDVDCQNAEFPPIGTEVNVNEFRSYDLAFLGTPPNEVCNAALRCIFALPEEQSRSLAGRSWFIENNKDRGGTLYPTNYLQLFRVTCPADTLLYMTILRMDLSCGTGFNDFIEVVSPELGTERLCGGLNGTIVQNSDLYNEGFGLILGQNATVQFRSDDDGLRGTGFTLVATCIDPRQSLRASCVDTLATLAWDPEFVDIIYTEFPTPKRVPAIHKRSVELMEARHELAKNDREKRFTRRFQKFDLGPNDTVTFTVDGRDTLLVIAFENGTVVELEAIWCLFTFNELFQTRIFTTTPPRPFSGEGTLEVYDDIGFLEYSINDVNAEFLPGPDESDFIRLIYEYAYRNWIAPFPIIDQSQTGGVDPFIFPFMRIDEDDRDLRFRQIEQLGWYRPEILGQDPALASCQRVTRPRVAPAAGTKIDEGIFEFCAFFLNSCTPALRTACQDLLRLDF